MYRKVFVLALLAVLIGCAALPALAAENVTTTFQPTGFGVAVSIDQHTYIQPNIKMNLTVYNYTTAPITFNFTTSQRYDFTIYNSLGIKIWKWSDGQSFFQVLGDLTLKPGDSVTYSAYYQGYLSEDLYTLKGELTATDMRLMKPRVMEATVSFWRYFVQ